MTKPKAAGTTTRRKAPAKPATLSTSDAATEPVGSEHSAAISEGNAELEANQRDKNRERYDRRMAGESMADITADEQSRA